MKIKNCKLIMSIEQMQDHQAWLNLRNKGIGGSDAGVIAGVNPWKSPFKLWLEKTGQAEPDDLSDNEAVLWGTKLEPIVADRFTEVTGKKVHRQGMVQSTEYPWLFANVDRLVVGEDAGLEIKTANARAEAAWTDDNIPDSYYLQCQHYMLVTGISKWYIACLIGGQHYVQKEIPRNEEDIKLLFQMEKDFWEKNVIGGEMPPVDGSGDCQKALVTKFHGGQSDPVEFPAAADALKEYDTAKENYDTAKFFFEEAKNKLCTILGDNEVGTCAGRVFTWKSQAGRVTINRKKLQKDFPEAYEACKKVGDPVRVLRVKD